ncbi:MAG: 2OG-Fe(II) oxygenase, partial [Mycobacterium sp.]
MPPTRWEKRVASGDWDSITTAVNDYGGALLPPLLTSGETARICRLYADDERFRATIDMERYRYGAGQYRYFHTPNPEPIDQLKQALYPRLLPIARDWAAKLGRDAPWPDSLDEWLGTCHLAGQTKSTALM